ncbi:hypothetical protein C470_02665 [Halorubrum distributum JCM 13561]|uniref:HEAT repeat domain-containing protein n=1 Tax=Halorubrum distributum JCM 13561 TaxID=1227483 RepID=M0P0Q1_9EURY|nr:hypothetical protein [Halorubrum litoreum]EMA63636.1 hypothetical protein C470_02665 [Halorubrum litoreum JCM 13561]
MTPDPEAIAETLAAADADETNGVIDDLSDLDVTARFRLYDDLFDACRPVFEDAADGYVRQSVVRTLREAYLGVERHPEGHDALDVEDASRAAIADQRERYVSFLLDALDDPDGRVRISAADAFDLLAVGLGMADLSDDRDRIAERLETLVASQPEKRQKHTEQARESLERLGVSGLLSGALPDDRS